MLQQEPAVFYIAFLMSLIQILCKFHLGRKGNDFLRKGLSDLTVSHLVEIFL